MMKCRLEIRCLRSLGLLLLLLLLSAACSRDVEGGATQDLAACALECVATATPEEIGGVGDEEPNEEKKQIILTGDNYWIGMVDNTANQRLTKNIEQYCLALADHAG